MTERKTLSVIITSYNSEDYVSRAIRSVLAQTFLDFELILVDNGSTDSTPDILAEYQRSDPERIRFFSETSRGSPAARNRGLKECSGRWLQYLDADDEILPDKLEKQLKLALEHDSDLVVGAYRKFRGDTLVVTRSPNVAGPWHCLIQSNLGITSSILWRKDKVLTAGGWNADQSSSQEYELMFRMLQGNAKVAIDAEPLTRVYIQENSVSQSNNPERLEIIVRDRIELRLAIRRFLEEIGRCDNELRRLIDEYLYTELMFNRDRIPTYCDRVLAEGAIEIGLPRKLKLLKDVYRQRCRRKGFSCLPGWMMSRLGRI